MGIVRTRRLFCSYVPWVLASFLGGCQSLVLDITPGTQDGSIAHDAGSSPPDSTVVSDAHTPREAAATHDASPQDTGATCPRGDAACRDASVSFFCSASVSQAAFPLELVGTSNPRFTSGVATRNADRAFVFTGLAATDGGSPCAIYGQAFDLTADASALGPAASLYLPTPSNGEGLFVHDVATAPDGTILLVYGFGGGPVKRPNQTLEGPFHALFFRSEPAAGSGAVPGLTVIEDVVLDPSTTLYGQAHVTWDNAAGAFHLSWQRPTETFEDASVYSVKVETFAPDGGGVATESYAQVPVAGDGVHLVNNTAEQGSVGVFGDLLGVAYIDLEVSTCAIALLTGAGLNDSLVGVSDAGEGTPFVVVAGTSAGLVYVRYLYDGQTVITELVTLDDAGAPHVRAGTGATGSVAISRARAVGDNAGGGVGLALLHSGDVSFAYVSPNAQLLLVPDASLPLYSDGGSLDEIAVGSFGGSFIFSGYSNTKHQVTAAVSGCTPP